LASPLTLQVILIYPGYNKVLILRKISKKSIKKIKGFITRKKLLSTANLSKSIINLLEIVAVNQLVER
jgi:aspartate ammonia-lyase